MTPFWIALQFLTRLPCPNIPASNAQQLSRSVLFYPLVGALIGLFLLSSIWLVSLTNAIEHSAIIAAFILTLWVMLTGALHLDGLGDSADAWLGGGTDKQRCFDIMADPRSGTAAVVSIILLLLLKFTAIEALVTQQQFLPLLLAPIIGRSAVLVLLLGTASARLQGLSANVQKTLPQNTAIAVVLSICILFIIIAPIIGSITLFITGLVTYLLRKLMLKRLGGLTGDTCGATIEIIEASVLLSWILLGSQFI